MINADEKYMRMCFALARRGMGKTAPNPLVGCVVLDKNGRLAAKGYHKKFGENHAERDALIKLTKDEARGGTLYVNLEPCSHFGKTPPCTDLIIEKGLKRVVIGMKDVNPKVDGITKLKAAGIEVDYVLSKEAEFFNRIFIKNMTRKLPYVVLKSAMTLDGKTATQRGDSKWITSDTARTEVYCMRQDFDCIMTSSNTIIADNPSMRHKFKCILDKDLRTDKNSNIYKTGEFYIASEKNTPLKDGMLDIEAVLKDLYKRGIYSVFAECGGTLAGSMLKNSLIDEVYLFFAPKILNDNSALSGFNGIKAEKISQAVDLEIYNIKQFPPDILIKALVKK